MMLDSLPITSSKLEEYKPLLHDEAVSYERPNMAKKKYYQGAKDRKDESVAMMGKSSGSFNGEFNDAPGSPSHMPQSSVYKTWTKPNYVSYDLGNSDNIKGVDEQMDADVRGAIKHRSKSKY